MPFSNLRQDKEMIQKADKRAVVQGAAMHDRRCPWKANTRRIRSSHCQLMDIGDHASPLLDP